MGDIRPNSSPVCIMHQAQALQIEHASNAGSVTKADRFVMTHRCGRIDIREKTGFRAQGVSG